MNSISSIVHKVKWRHIAIAVMAAFLLIGITLASHISYAATVKKKTRASAPPATSISGSEVSRDLFRDGKIDGDGSWSMDESDRDISIPYSQSSNEKTSLADLKTTVSSAQSLYSSSAGKVKDDGTRAHLSASIRPASDFLSTTTDTTQIDTAKVASMIADINGSMNTVNTSINDETRAREDAAANSSSSSPTVNTASLSQIQAYALSLFGRYGWDNSQWDSLNYIVDKESGWNPNAVNSSSGASGLFQCLGHSECETSSYANDYRVQTKWGLDYIASRYGNPNTAAAHERSNGWY